MELYFICTGLHNGQVPFIAKFTMSEVITNSGRLKDTELFYTLQELKGAEIEAFLKFATPFQFRVSRDNEESIAIFSRVGKRIYDETVIFEG